ncbi:MAG: archaellum component FlaC [Verrucomicrobiales bacterium]|jgi:archaellum component FlaC
MKREELKSRLGELHSELEKSDEVSEDTLPLLRQISDDLDRLLDEADDTDDSTLLERMSDGLLALEARHPKLHMAVNRVSDALANIGI